MVVMIFIFVPAFVLAVVVVIVVVPATTIAVVVMVPFVAMFKAAARSLPVSAVIAACFIARDDPDCTNVRRTSPVALVPVIMTACWIPVAFHPSILGFGPWALRAGGIDMRCWRRADLNADRDLAKCARRSCEERAGEQECSYSQFPIEFHVHFLSPRL